MFCILRSVETIQKIRRPVSDCVQQGRSDIDNFSTILNTTLQQVLLHMERFSKGNKP